MAGLPILSRLLSIIRLALCAGAVGTAQNFVQDFVQDVCSQFELCTSAQNIPTPELSRTPPPTLWAFGELEVDRGSHAAPPHVLVALKT